VSTLADYRGKQLSSGLELGCTGYLSISSNTSASSSTIDYESSFAYANSDQTNNDDQRNNNNNNDEESQLAAYPLDVNISYVMKRLYTNTLHMATLDSDDDDNNDNNDDNDDSEEIGSRSNHACYDPYTSSSSTSSSSYSRRRSRIHSVIAYRHQYCLSAPLMVRFHQYMTVIFTFNTSRWSDILENNNNDDDIASTNSLSTRQREYVWLYEILSDSTLSSSYNNNNKFIIIHDNNNNNNAQNAYYYYHDDDSNRNWVGQSNNNNNNDNDYNNSYIEGIYYDYPYIHFVLISPNTTTSSSSSNTSSSSSNTSSSSSSSSYAIYEQVYAIPISPLILYYQTAPQISLSYSHDSQSGDTNTTDDFTNTTTVDNYYDYYLRNGTCIIGTNLTAYNSSDVYYPSHYYQQNHTTDDISYYYYNSYYYYDTSETTANDSTLSYLRRTNLTRTTTWCSIVYAFNPYLAHNEAQLLAIDAYNLRYLNNHRREDDSNHDDYYYSTSSSTSTRRQRLYADVILVAGKIFISMVYYPALYSLSTYNYNLIRIVQSDGFNDLLSSPVDTRTQPSPFPTSTPTSHPTSHPTSKPTVLPTRPFNDPTSFPTMRPTRKPTVRATRPTYKPTFTRTPTIAITRKPTANPTYRPSRSPVTRRPTSSPFVATAAPTAENQKYEILFVQVK
jgi:hypothetical protein